MSANSHPPNSKNVLCNAAAGAAAGVVAATFVCPLDVIKTRFQVHGLPKLGDANIKGSLIVGSLEQIWTDLGTDLDFCRFILQCMTSSRAFFVQMITNSALVLTYWLLLELELHLLR